MGFLGPVTRFDGALVRPHDIEVHRERVQGSVPATVLRLHRLGFEFRVHLRAGGEDVWAQLAPREIRALHLRPGDDVWLWSPR
jgi:sulfate transport system ATP-binding protein